MVAERSASGSRFIVDLGDIKLSAVVEKQVEAEIQAAVLRALADIDEHGDSRLRKPIFDQFPGQTLGLWLDPDRLPGVDGPLTLEDHTLIVRAVMEHPWHVLRYLPDKSKTARPSPEEVLEAALQVGEIDQYVKDRIRAVLDILPKLEEAQAAAPASVKRAVDSLRQQLANKPVEEQRSVLRDRELRRRHREVGGLAEGMEMAARMLEDGQDSIYSPDFSFYAQLTDGQRPSRTAARDAIGAIGSWDTIGATAGGIAGSLVGGLGAAPGAVAGGAGASVGAAIGRVIDWLG